MANHESEYLTTRELAELLRIKERKVYDLAASGTVPCSKATGKLLFPRESITAWLAAHQSGPEQSEPVPAVFLGSHDPLLDWALRESQCGIATYFDGSSDGLERFVEREGVACGLHLNNPELDGWNTQLVRQRCAGMPVVLIEWAKRQRGIICKPQSQDNDPMLGLQNIADRRVTSRQSGAGAQSLFLALLAQQGIDAQSINWAPTVRTEDEAALSVLDGKADIAFGLQTLAQQYRLDFIPLIQERFDLLISRRTWFDPPMQQFLAFCRSGQFAARAAEMAGYDVSALGTVHFNGP